jgi:[ribosomal protein S18]-alanine N-acetyltransferase
MTAVAQSRLVIRRAEPGDVVAMLRIEEASFSDPWTESSFASALALDHMHVLVAEQGRASSGDGASALVGYVVALVAGADAEIADLAVAPEARRRGTGRALLERILDELVARDVQACYLEVRESNRAARTLYEASGFRTVGRRRGYYRQPVEDALLLKRGIGPT